MRRYFWAGGTPQTTRSSRRKAVVYWPLSPPVLQGVGYMLLVALHTGYFVFKNGGGWISVFVSALMGFVLGLALYAFGVGVAMVRERLFKDMRPHMEGFLLFFIYLLGYAATFSIIVSMPVEWCVYTKTGSAQLARQYVLYAINLIIVMAILCWLVRLPGLLKMQKRSSK